MGAFLNVRTFFWTLTAVLRLAKVVELITSIVQDSGFFSCPRRLAGCRGAIFYQNFAIKLQYCYNRTPRIDGADGDIFYCGQVPEKSLGYAYSDVIGWVGCDPFVV